jgi:hypothetical protein
MNIEDADAPSVQERPAYSIAEWCVEARVSVALFFKEQRAGRGPYVAHAGRRTIVIESPHKFYRRRVREAASAQPRMEAV